MFRLFSDPDPLKQAFYQVFYSIFSKTTTDYIEQREGVRDEVGTRFVLGFLLVVLVL